MENAIAINWCIPQGHRIRRMSRNSGQRQRERERNGGRERVLLIMWCGFV